MDSNLLDVDTFSQQLRAMHWRIAELYQNVCEIPARSPEFLLPIAFKELGCASEELHVAAEELLQQNEELALARAAIEVERQRYQDLFEFAPDAYIVTNSTGIIQEANRAASTLFNISAAYLIGKPLSIFVPESERQSFRYEINQLHQVDRVQEWVLRLCPRQGQPFDAALTIASIRNLEGKSICLRICIRDITERQRALKTLHSIDYDLTQDRQRHFYTKGDNIPLNRQSMWLVCQGIVKLSTVFENGEETIVGLAGPQMPFGSSLTSLSTYQAIALSKNVQLVSISLVEIGSTPSLAQAILPKITRRIQQTESFLAVSGQRRVIDRLEQLLLLLKQEIGQPVLQGTRLSVRLTHSDLANACCTTRVTMTRLLGKLQQQGKITFDRKNHMIITSEDFDILSQPIAVNY